MNKIIKDFNHFYSELKTQNLSQLYEIYNDNIIFEDPLHKIHGLDNITLYFEQMITNVTSCHFYIKDVVEADNQAFITWEMHFSHPKLNKGNVITLPGTSHLKYTDKIDYHRDYFDVGSMIYEHIPVLNYVIGKIKNRMTS